MIPIMGSVLLDLVAPGASNPFKPMLFISYRLPGSEDGQPKYAKGLLVCSHMASLGNAECLPTHPGSLIHSVLCHSFFFRPSILHPQASPSSGAKTWHQEAREIGPIWRTRLRCDLLLFLWIIGCGE